MTSKVAIIGSGFGMYGLLPSFSRIDECDVVSICGKNSDRMEQYCKKFNLNHYDNWKEMLHTEHPDAIAIAVVPKYFSRSKIIYIRSGSNHIEIPIIVQVCPLDFTKVKPIRGRKDLLEWL